MAGSERITRHRGLLWLSGLALALVVGGAGCLIGFAWQAVNHQEAVRETVVVRRLLDRALSRVQNETASSTSFDETYRRTEGPFDRAWLDANLTAYLKLTFGHDLVLVFDQRGRLGYAAHDGGRADPKAYAALGQAVAPLVRRVQGQEMRRRLGLDPPGPVVIGNVAWTSAVVQAAGRTWLVGASTVAPSNGLAYGPGPAAVLVSGKEVDWRFLADLEADAALKGARLLPHATDGLGVVTLPGSSAAVAWTLGRPGADALAGASGYIALVTVVLAATLVALGLRIRRLLQEIEAHDVALAATMVQLTEARDQAEAASLAKSQIVAHISHEIRTPLNGMLGMAQVLERDAPTDAQRERLRTIVRSGRALLTVLNDVLDIAKIEAGKLEISLAPFDLAELVEGVRESYQDTAGAKGVELTCSLADDLGDLVEGDAARIRQILLNLVSNAVKFTPAGTVRIEAVRRKEQVRIAIYDQGPGIPAERRADLFEKFAQVDAMASRPAGGTGLGLAISRELARLMGGDILLETKEGAGSIFTLALPLPIAADDPSAQATPVAVEALAERRLRILAAEDNLTNQMVLQAMLDPFDIELVLVGTGAAAVEAAAEGRFDVVLMDVHMPVMDGIEATRRIRADEAAEGRTPTPILALTADAMRHQVEAQAEAGMTGSIAKPIQLERLLEAIAVATAQPSAGSALLRGEAVDG